MHSGANKKTMVKSLSSLVSQAREKRLSLLTRTLLLVTTNMVHDGGVFNFEVAVTLN